MLDVLFNDREKVDRLVDIGGGGLGGGGDGYLLFSMACCGDENDDSCFVWPNEEELLNDELTNEELIVLFVPNVEFRVRLRLFMVSDW